MQGKTIVTNKRARRDYEVLDTLEAGIELQGTEVKSLRNGKINFKDSYADVKEGEAYLVGAHISPYEQGNIYNHDPERRRRLLLHKREIVRLAQRINEKGFTLVPLKLYFKNGKVKVELGLCRGKNVVDKKRDIQERDIDRDVQRQLKDVNYRK